MMIALDYIGQIHSYMDRYGDKRTSKWVLANRPYYTLSLCFFYLLIVKVLLPKVMENRKPFQLKRVLIVYNVMQVISNTLLFYELAMIGWLTGDYNWICQPLDKSNSTHAIRMQHIVWWLLISKFTDFFDTVFFILRKKSSQVTVLHVFHHFVVPLSIWVGLKFSPGGQGTLFTLINCFIHTLMYSYYCLSAMGPSLQKYLWWKKYLTTLQMIQFVTMFFHSMVPLFSNCDYSKEVSYTSLSMSIVFLGLFADFYVKSYRDKTPNKDRKSH